MTERSKLNEAPERVVEKKPPEMHEFEIDDVVSILLSGNPQKKNEGTFYNSVQSEPPKVK